jgi:hypothetical protein
MRNLFREKPGLLISFPAHYHLVMLFRRQQYYFNYV